MVGPTVSFAPGHPRRIAPLLLSLSRSPLPLATKADRLAELDGVRRIKNEGCNASQESPPSSVFDIGIPDSACLEMNPSR